MFTFKNNIKIHSKYLVNSKNRYYSVASNYNYNNILLLKKKIIIIIESNHIKMVQ